MPGAERSIREVFANVGTNPGLKVWRIQKTKMILQAKGNVGTFYAGDCYIAIKTWKDGLNVRRNVHLWIGSEVSEDKEINALENVSDADDEIEGSTLHRQIQHYETRAFLDLFSNGVKYLCGCHGNYKHFDQGQYVKRLFLIKGKRDVRISQVPLHYESLNEGDSFVLDDEWTIYCWNGEHSNKVERTKAIEVARTIRDELCYGKAEIVIADQNVDKKEERLFFQALGGRGQIKPANEEENDGSDTKEKILTTPVKVFRLFDNNGEVDIHKVQTTSLDKEILDSKGCFIVDCGRAGVYIWVGSRCSKLENRVALINAIIFLEENQYPKWTPVTKILQGREPKRFISNFDKWPQKMVMVTDGHVKMMAVDHPASKMWRGVSIQQEMIDDASGPIKIWRIEGVYQIKWPHNYYGMFYERYCYIIQYASTPGNQHIIYIWQGQSASDEDKENTMHLAQTLDHKLKGKTTQIKIVHGKEPEHFLKLFKGKLVTLMGGADDSPCGNDVRFFHIEGNNLYNTRAVQIPLETSLLQSEDVSLLQLQGKTHIWEGSMANKEQKDFAEVAADRLVPEGDLVIFQEGYEPQEFWRALGGKTEYNLGKTQKKDIRKPCLFHCSNASGSFKVDEIITFDQKDLHGDDVMILDVSDEVYIWIGQGANATEKNKAWDTVKEFVQASGRSLNETYMIQVHQGHETGSFISHFEDWDAEREMLPYSILKKQIQHENTDAKNKCCHRNAYKQQTSTWGEQRVLKRAQYNKVSHNSN